MLLAGTLCPYSALTDFHAANGLADLSPFLVNAQVGGGQVVHKGTALPPQAEQKVTEPITFCGALSMQYCALYVMPQGAHAAWQAVRCPGVVCAPQPTTHALDTAHKCLKTGPQKPSKAPPKPK